MQESFWILFWANWAKEGGDSEVEIQDNFAAG